MAEFKNPVIQQTYETYKSRGGDKKPSDWYEQNWKTGGYPITQARMDFAQMGGAPGQAPLGGASLFGPAPPYGALGGGGSGGGGGGAEGIDPRYWGLLEKQHQTELGLLGQQKGFAQQGYALTAQEAATRRANMQRLLQLRGKHEGESLGLLKEKVGLQVPEELFALEQAGRERSSFLDKARLFGASQVAKQAALAVKTGTVESRQRLSEMQEEMSGQVRLLDESLKQARLAKEEELARLEAQEDLSNVEYQIALLRKK